MFKKFIERIKAAFTFKPITIKLEPKYTPFQWNLIQKHERFIGEKNRNYFRDHTEDWAKCWDEEYYQEQKRGFFAHHAKAATARGK